MTHKGEFIKQKIKGSGISIQSVSEKINISRPTLYRWFTEPDLGNNQMIKLAQAINYNIFEDFPKMKMEDVEESTDFTDSIYKSKYFNLLEKYSSLQEEMVDYVKKEK